MRVAGILLGFVSGVLLMSQAWADETTNDAEQTIRNATRDIYIALEARQDSTADSLYRLVNKILVPHADLRRMSRLVLGKHWRTASSDQRTRFENEFRNLLVRTYATAILGFSPQQIEYLPPRQEKNPQRAVVRTRVHRPGKPVVAIDYHMYRRNGEWRVYDVRIEGISMVASYRTTFAAEIRDLGLDGLLEELSRKNH